MSDKTASEERKGIDLWVYNVVNACEKNQQGNRLSIVETAILATSLENLGRWVDERKKLEKK